MPAAAAVTEVTEGFCRTELNPFGPLQLLPAAELDVRLSVWPVHRGLLLPATGVAGSGVTVTFILTVPEVQPEATVYREYVPAAAVVAAGIEGFCKADVKPLGPLQLLPLAAVDVRLRACPAHMGLLLADTGFTGSVFTTTLMVAVS